MSYLVSRLWAETCHKHFIDNFSRVPQHIHHMISLVLGRGLMGYLHGFTYGFWIRSSPFQNFQKNYLAIWLTYLSFWDLRGGRSRLTDMAFLSIERNLPMDWTFFYEISAKKVEIVCNFVTDLTLKIFEVILKTWRLTAKRGWPCRAQLLRSWFAPFKKAEMTSLYTCAKLCLYEEWFYGFASTKSDFKALTMTNMPPTLIFSVWFKHGQDMPRHMIRASTNQRNHFIACSGGGLRITYILRGSIKHLNPSYLSFSHVYISGRRCLRSTIKTPWLNYLPDVSWRLFGFRVWNRFYYITWSDSVRRHSVLITLLRANQHQRWSGLEVLWAPL